MSELEASPSSDLNSRLASTDAIPIGNGSAPLSGAMQGMVFQLADGSIQACNARAQELLGLSAEQMQGLTSLDGLRQIVREDGSPFPGEAHPAMVALQTGQPCRDVAMGICTPNGELAWLNATSQPLFQANGSTPYAVVTTFTQIASPQRLSSIPGDALARSQYVLETLENISDAFCCLDPDWRITYVNAQAMRLLNRSPESILGKNHWEVFPESVGSRIEREYRRAVAERVTVSFEVFYPPHHRWYAVRAYPIASGLAIYFQDVTAQKQTQEALRRSEERYRALFDAIDEGFCIVEMLFDENEAPIDYRFLEINPAFERHTGLVQAVGKTARQLLPDLEERWFEIYGNVVLTGECVRFEERSAVMNRWFDVFAFRFGEPSDRRVAVRFKDISDRKQVEVSLHQSEERLSLALEAAGMATWDIDLQTEKRIWSEKHFTILGYPPNVTGEGSSEMWHSRVHPDDVERIGQEVERARQTQSIFSLEHRIVRADNNQIRWLSVFGRFLYTEVGEAVRSVGVFFDISDRKQSEIDLQEQIKLRQVIVDSIGDGLILANPRGEIVIVNQAARDMFGSLIGDRACEQWSDTHGIFLPDRLTPFPNEELPLVRAIRGESVTDVEVFVRHDSALEGRWMSISGYPVVDVSNEINGGVITCRDITERKRTEEELRQKNAILDLINQSAPTPIFVKNRQGCIIYANPATLEVLGKPASEVIGYRDCDIYASPEDGAIVSQNDRRIMESGQTEVVEESPDGIRTFLAMKAPYRNAEGEVIGLVGVSSDISDRVQLERDRERVLAREQAAREAAEKANRIKDEFLAVLSHELRTPLNPILGWSKLLQSGKLSAAKTAEAIITIERNAKLQSQLIEDLLDVSRILRGKLSLTLAPVSLETAIASAIETVWLAAENKNIAIQTVFEVRGAKVSGDAGRLQQVIWNLLSNAVKFTPAGGRVTVGLAQVEHQVQVVVSDTGKGIQPDFLPYVFEHFRQEDGAISRKFGGLGLGLAIARQIIELHGGEICAESAGENRGATFTVTLPLLRQTSECIPEIDAEALPPSQPLPLAGLSILVVDDEPDSRDFVAFVLEHAGAAVVAVPSAIAALEAISQLRPDCLVSDIGMPNMDGYALLQEIRSNSDGTARVPAIALTAYAGEINRQQALQAGFQQHLPKPIDPDELVRAIAVLLI
ncbi:PAS domain-containing protein [Altericista sp. CCNU0014]|uniref:hybrid sensor histidine kinase/response regulator n=1 Tax=Altericista sp. CCNU0014 TaxID=3082949 RepID=UPI003850464E